MYDGYLIDHCINYPQNESDMALKWMREITEDQLKEYFIWSCVRNPYDRFMSMSAMFSSDPNRFAKGLKKYRRKGIVKRHTEPQHIYTHHKGVQIPQMIIRFENVQSEFKTVCRAIGLEEHELGVRNTTKHGSWSEEMNNETIDFINKYYKLDFEYFNYLMI